MLLRREGRLITPVANRLILASSVGYNNSLSLILYHDLLCQTLRDVACCHDNDSTVAAAAEKMIRVNIGGDNNASALFAIYSVSRIITIIQFPSVSSGTSNATVI